MRPNIRSTDRATIRCGTSIITGLVVYDRQWTDDTTPRTDRPVRFTVQTYDGEYLNPLRPLRHA